MTLEWMGHACFLMTAADGTRVVTDPYDDSVGIAMLPLEAELVTMSHEHHDHNFTAMLAGSPMIARGLESVQVGGVSVRALAAYHDDAQGALRGKNAIRIFSIDGLKIVHMGDQGCMPPPDVLGEIADADVMLLPVGGLYTVDAQMAAKIVDNSRPRCVVPMHYKTAHCAYPIEGVAPFLRLMGAQSAAPVKQLSWADGCAPRGVVVMAARAES